MSVFPELLLLGAGLLGQASAPAAEPTIVDRPIPFPPERSHAMLEYRRHHEDPEATDLRIEPRVVVVHHTAVDTLEGSFRAFERPFLAAGRKRLERAGRVNVSTHFLVDRTGRIFRLMPETRMARHTIGLNHVAIGIENVGGTARSPLTRAQLLANAALVRWLRARHPITHLIGHHEYRRMESHPYWRERDPTYRTVKQDPGEDFMRGLRAELGDSGLSPAP